MLELGMRENDVLGTRRRMEESELDVRDAKKKFDVWDESMIFGARNLLFRTAKEIERDVTLEDEKEFVLRTGRMEVWCSRQKNERQFGIRERGRERI